MDPIQIKPRKARGGLLLAERKAMIKADIGCRGIRAGNIGRSSISMKRTVNALRQVGAISAHIVETGLAKLLAARRRIEGSSCPRVETTEEIDHESNCITVDRNGLGHT